MFNMFKELNKLERKASSDAAKPYWESGDDTFGYNVDPDGNQYSEEEVCRGFRESDRKRLMEWG